MTTLEGDRVAAPYLRFHDERIRELLPPEVTRVTATHGGRTFSVYLWVGDELVAECRGSRSVLNAVVQAVHTYRERAAA